MTLDTKDDRTLFFDMMPVFFRTRAGVKVKLKLYTVPGQVMHESTRRIVLQGSTPWPSSPTRAAARSRTTLAYWQQHAAPTWRPTGWTGARSPSSSR